jgi:type III secretory pathway lipoprotein EscJ
MRKEPSGADAIFVVVCLLVVAACFVALMVDLSHGMLREMLAILSLRQ